MNNFRHLPIMPNEVNEHLIINKNGKYLDCTFGRGGHSKSTIQIFAIFINN
jgi:16S rRNA (cytosine1402-N4)-methyltransferase